MSSNTVATESEEILLREAIALGIRQEEISKLLDDLCALAFESKADYLVTHNQRRYEPMRQSGIRVVTLKDFLDTVQSGK